MRRPWVLLAYLLFFCASCYQSHTREGLAAVDAPEDEEALPKRPKLKRPDLPPIECEIEPAPDCVSSFPRIMIIMDASSSMLAGRTFGGNNWDKARFAIAGNPQANNPSDEGFVVPAFARELMVRGNLVTIEDVVHLGMIVFNAADSQRLVLRYTACATDNIAWSMDPYTSCELPQCSDPYVGEPSWTYKNSDVDRNPPFAETTFSYLPPCNTGGAGACIGTVYNTYTGEGLSFARQTVADYRNQAEPNELTPATRFANILITDGETSPESMPIPVLEQMAAEGVPTYVIGLDPENFIADTATAVVQLDSYAKAGGTDLATLIEADEKDIADAFAETVTRIIDDLGTDPCCQPNHCADYPE